MTNEAPAGMHPDAVYSALWSPDAPVERRDGTVTLTVRGKRTQTPLEPRGDADDVAAALITGPVFVKSFYTLFNHEPILIYNGTGITDLARRRG